MSEFADIDVNDVKGVESYRITPDSVRTYRKYAKSYRSFALLRNDISEESKSELEPWNEDDCIDLPCSDAILDEVMRDWILAVNQVVSKKGQKGRAACKKARGYLAHEFIIHNLPAFLRPKKDKGKVSSWPKFDAEWEKLQRTDDWIYDEPKEKVENTLEEDRKLMNRGIDMSCYSENSQQYALNLNLEQAGRDKTLSRLDFNRSELVHLKENGLNKPVFRTAVVVSKATQLGLQITGI